MRHDYCTLFDSRYLPRAVALYRSLERHGGDFTMRAVCMDLESHRLLTALALPRMRAVAIAEVEAWDADLPAVRPVRSEVEYAWTAAPVICRFFLADEPELEALTYLDADLYFSSSPAPLFEEMGDTSIMLVPHRASATQDAMFGIYNVGWVTFRNDDAGNAALDWWRVRCLEWCYDAFEPGRYGDQKYLDDWPERFPAVKVCEHPGAGLAPWNDARHTVAASAAGAVQVDGRPLVYYHHASARLYASGRVADSFARAAGPFRLNAEPARLVWTVLARPPETMLDLIWAPYVRAVAEAIDELACPGLGLRPFEPSGALMQIAGGLIPLQVVYRRLPVRVRHRIGRRASPA